MNLLLAYLVGLKLGRTVRCLVLPPNHSPPQSPYSTGVPPPPKPLLVLPPPKPKE